MEMPCSKLLGMNVFSDAISLSLSLSLSRTVRTAPLIKVTISNEVLAALVNAAIQKSQA
jgi:hypothetical protein